MKCPRIYSNEPLAASQTVRLNVEQANHLRVLRLRNGHPLVLFNGQGGEYPAELLQLDRRQATVLLGEHRPRDAESPLQITLFQGVSKGDRMDWTIQKAVELGVSRIVPVLTARSVVQLTAARLEKKTAHWEAVVISACEQCGRNSLPPVSTPVTLTDALSEPVAGLRCLLDPAGGRRLGELPRPGSTGLALLVGPEGGLTDAELADARAHAYIPVLLGPRVLRTETAGIAALAAFQVLWGDLG